MFVTNSKLMFRLNNLIKITISKQFLGNSRNLFHPVREKMSDNSVEILDSPEFKSVLSPELHSVAAPFLQNGYDVRIVGGAVRDILLGLQPKDVDLGTNATPEKMIQLFKQHNIHFIETGLNHGTITAHVNKQDFEVTTLRIDAETDGRHAKVEFTQNWKLDAERRDLTFNAMSLGLDGSLYDYFGGKEDLSNRRVRFVGDPELRIKEDYLRILRYFRFYGRIASEEDNHDHSTLNVIRECAEGLKKIAVERIWMEVSKILTGNYTPSILHHMYELNVSQCIGLPTYSKESMQELTRAWKEHNIHPLQPETLLCSLVNTAEEAENLARKWKLSNAGKALGKFVTQHRGPKPHEHVLKPYQDIIVSAPYEHVRSLIKSYVLETLHYLGRHDHAQEINTWCIPVFPITGRHLKKLGVKPGPEFGKMLGKLKEIWKESYYTASEADLLEKAKSLIEG
ncbi:unnamed protein product [Pocillopora meandrina]|uniref:CCA tRNA nucleotidyltransferase 1, mitochondrial n=1 Tax=Pocillopora meandrina TaxID=46732 RepID=A0AAU9WV55_9CNID|nr:unnamed protein product [Pocillopora meandrina]